MNRTKTIARGSHDLGNGVKSMFGDTQVSNSVIRRRVIGVSAEVRMDLYLPPFKFAFSRETGSLMVEPPRKQSRPAEQHETLAFIGKVHDALVDARREEGHANRRAYPEAKLRLDRLERVVGMIESIR